jgi:Calcineurin-like phosphoesterase
MRNQTALVLGIVGGLVLVGLAALVIGLSRPSPAAIATPTPEPTLSRPGASVTAGPSPAASGAARASSVPSGTQRGPETLIAAGDITSCAVTSDSATAKLVESIPGIVATLGDDAYESGSAREYRQCYDPIWGAFLDRTRPAPGNHEYLTSGAAGYFGYFGLRAGDPKLGYYAYDLGAWRLYALNSNCADIGGCGPGSAQVAWLKADLAAHPTQCVLAYWHHPRFSSGEHGSNAFVAGLWDTLVAAGADIVLNGHDHDYERFAPMNDTGQVDTTGGIVEFVVGTGGRSHYPFTRNLPTSQVRDDTTFGVLDLTLSPGGWSSRFVPVAGQTFTDSASGTCH